MTLKEKLKQENFDLDSLSGMLVINHDDKTINICNDGIEQYANYYCWKNDIIDDWTNAYITANLDYEKMFFMIADDVRLETVPSWDLENEDYDIHENFEYYKLIDCEDY